MTPVSSTEIRQQLHHYIDVANDKDIAAMFSFMEDKSAQPYTFTQEELDEFYSRREKFLKGGSIGYSVEDVHSQLRKGKNGL